MLLAIDIGSVMLLNNIFIKSSKVDNIHQQIKRLLPFCLQQSLFLYKKSKIKVIIHLSFVSLHTLFKYVLLY